MICTRLFGGLILGGLLVLAVSARPAVAQCSTCATPAAVAYAPAYTAAYAPAPVVYQTYRPTTGWYPGAVLDRWRMNRWSRSAAYAPTYATAYAPTYATAYAPTYATAYAAAYTPTFSPSQWGVSYAPTYTAAYRPAYPLSYSAGYATAVVASPVSPCATCCADPCGCSRPVVMQAVADGCSTCAGGSYVAPATYETSATGCAGCAPSATSTYIPPPNTPAPAATMTPTPAPAILPGESTPDERIEAQKAETSVVEPPPADSAEPAPPATGTDATMFQPPELYDPGGRVTQRPNVPVWNAVYHSRAAVGQPTSQKVSSSPKAKPTAADVARDAQGWTSGGK